MIESKAIRCKKTCRECAGTKCKRCRGRGIYDVEPVFEGSAYLAGSVTLQQMLGRLLFLMELCREREESARALGMREEEIVEAARRSGLAEAAMGLDFFLTAPPAVRQRLGVT